MNHQLFKRAVFAGVLGGAASAWAVINPGLQPMDLYQRYTDVVSAKVESFSAEKKTILLTIDTRYLGSSVPDQVTIQFGGSVENDFEPSISSSLKPGSEIIAFVGKQNRRRRNDLMFYADGFYVGERVDDGNWLLDKGDTQELGIDGKAIDSLMGTWNGSADQLKQMMADVRDGRCHFPRFAYARFKQDIVIDQLAGPAHGVALFDLDGDDRLDIYACSPAGNRLYFQMEPLKFARADEQIGHIKSGVSCSVADVNADGRFDLLVDHTVFLNKLESNQFALKELTTLPLPDGAKFKTASFVELNGDGHPDVLVSLQGGGLIAFYNKADGSGLFGEAKVLVEKGDGYFSPGDWNGDGRMDLFYAVDRGVLLIQDQNGAFSKLDHDFGLNFVSGTDQVTGQTGAGCFIPWFADQKMGLAIPTESSWAVIKNGADGPEDVTEYGNEISEGSFMHLATIPVDLNMDGTQDLYTISRAENGQNRFIIHRGYGSFMLAPVHKSGEYMFQGPAEEYGGLGIAAGDVNDDGAPDLLIAHPNGVLSLILNDTLSMRVPVEYPTDDIKNLLNMRLLTVRVAGLTGVTGARVTVEDEGGRIVGHQQVGTAVATGCAMPRTLLFSVPRPALYTVKVRFSDGLETKETADLTTQPRVLLVAERGDEF